MKHSQSGDVSQAAQKPKGRKKLHRGKSEDVPYFIEPQVQKTATQLNVTLLSTFQCCLRVQHIFSFSSQEFVEVKHVEKTSDTERYPSLEGHYRAASLPRLNAEYYVSSAAHKEVLFDFTM